MQKRGTIHISCFIGILLLLVGMSCKGRLSDEKRRVVIIQSFEPEYIGYKNSEKKIDREFSGQNIDADIKTFYLDCDSHLEKEEQQRIYNYLDSISDWKPEAILVYDDQATYSFITCQHPLSRQIPTVFAGVNYPNWKLLAEHSNITGFWDKPEHLGTINFIKTTFGSRRLNFWTDNTYLGRQATQGILQELHSAGIDKIERSGFTQEENEKRISRKDSINTNMEAMFQKSDTMIFNLINARESSANTLLWSLSSLGRHSIFIHSKWDFIAQRLGLLANTPTCTAINEGFGYGYGILGGYITPVDEQYRSSIRVISNILKGENVQNIPIIKSTKFNVADWRELERWHIPLNKLPKDCQIINMPFTERYKAYIIIFGCILFAIITMVIFALLHLYQKENRNKQQAQENLKKGERFLSLALAGGRVYAFQLKNDYFYFDSDFYSLLGLEERPIPIDEYKSYLLPEDEQVFIYNVEKARQGLIQKKISQTRCDFNGHGHQWWEYRYTYNIEENIFSGLCLNIQQEKEAEQELIDSRRKAEESDKMKSTFLANMSHEIRTPLNAIVGFSNIIAGDDVELDADEKKEFIKLINSNCGLLLKLINDILDLSRIESGHMEFTFASIDLTALINDIYRTHQLLMPQQVTLIKETPKQPVMIETDHYRLTQIITNFINNAAKFTKKGHIKIGYNYQGGDSTVSLFIEDTGIGIPEKQQKAVFERFNKLNEFAQGTGLGLAICQVIIQRFGGNISLKSEEGKGSCFTITLPIQAKSR